MTSPAPILRTISFLACLILIAIATAAPTCTPLEPVEPQYQWYETCGDPVCGGWHDSGLEACTTQEIGDGCSAQGAQCDPANMCNSHLLCTDSDPRLQAGGCPISRRIFKQEIRYLTSEERVRYREDLMSMKLATYRYKAAPAEQHLGFIIEDEEPSAAVDADRDRVELYGYLSMAVAAIQEQDKEITALREEIAALRESATRP